MPNAIKRPVPDDDGSTKSDSEESRTDKEHQATTEENSSSEPGVPCSGSRGRPFTTSTRIAFIISYQHPAPETSLFVGLCAYLCVLLRWGWHVKTTDLDAFILLYSSFCIVLPELEAAQREQSRLVVPSYHQWFRAQRPDDFTKLILTEETLRAIWAENRYEFLRAELALELISRRNAPWLSLDESRFDTAANEDDLTEMDDADALPQTPTGSEAAHSGVTESAKDSARMQKLEDWSRCWDI